MKDLETIARRIRSTGLKMIHRAGSGHPGGSLSCADILAYLYFREMNVRPGEPTWEGRDRFVLSKGHACPSLYAVLALKGFFPEEKLATFRQVGGLLQGHPDAATPGIEAVSGSLGMGLSQGLGIALGGQRLGASFRTYVLLGDGDMQEGNTWEALMATGFFGIDSLTAILDSNKLQGDGAVSEQMDYTPTIEKIGAFRWHAIEINGHDFSEIEGALEEARSTRGKPTFILAHTTKGKGISFMEDNNAWHGSRAPTDEELERALSELGEPIQ